MITRVMICLAVVAGLAGGCVELGILLQGGLTGDSTTEPASGDSDQPDQPPDSNGTGTIPVVRLSVSNPNPLAGEEVRFTCTLLDGDSASVSFSFQSGGDRLMIDSRAGTASYIVDQSDIGIELVVTCTATNASGTSEHSNQEVVIASQ